MDACHTQPTTRHQTGPWPGPNGAPGGVRGTRAWRGGWGWLLVVAWFAALPSAKGQTFDLSSGWQFGPSPGAVGVPVGTDAAEHRFASDRKATADLWAARNLEIPGWWQGQRLELEVRTPKGQAAVWVDGQRVEPRAEATRQDRFEFSRVGTPGLHRVVVWRGSDRSLPDGEGRPWVLLRSTPRVWLEDPILEILPSGHGLPSLGLQIGNDWAGEGSASVEVMLEPVPPASGRTPFRLRREQRLAFFQTQVRLPLGPGSGFVPAPGSWRLVVVLHGSVLDRGVDHQVVSRVQFEAVPGGGWRVETHPEVRAAPAFLSGTGPAASASTSVTTIHPPSPPPPGPSSSRHSPSPSPWIRSLAGSWRVRLDPDDLGVRQSWFERPLASAERMHLPGTLEQAAIGVAPDPVTREFPVPFPFTRFPGVRETNRVDSLGFLVPGRLHLGPAWYERDFEVPRAWEGRNLLLRLERVLWRSDVWVDGVPAEAAGSTDSLAVPHEHRLGRLLPGRHRVLVRVDNRMQVNLSTLTHAYGPETQGRWNGLVGRLALIAMPAVVVRRLELHPAPDRRSVRVVGLVDVEEGGEADGILHLELRKVPDTGPEVAPETPAIVRVQGSEEPGGQTPLGSVGLAVRLGPGAGQRVEGTLTLATPAEPWDEFHPVLYRIDAALDSSQGLLSQAAAEFGFRHIEREGRSIRVNGRRVFLRGTLDCAVYPETGHPPVTRAGWERIFRIVKAYGFNHVRFHTWCPPEAAFAVADRLGLYLQPEAAAWVDDWTRETWNHPAPLGRDPAVTAFLRSEIRRMSETYGNHPSFALFAIGNEFGNRGTDWEAVESWVAEAKARDPRRLYLGATARKTGASDDLWVTHSVHGQGTRGTGPARTDWDFSEAALASELPVVAHETGQRPVFPDFQRLLPRFHGPRRPWNYQRLQRGVEDAGLGGQVRAFERASARFQAVLYKAEHEGMRRTLDYAGYQLLMLNDFTGQSEALVGILDPFGNPKGGMSPDGVRSWNGDTVPLARFPRYTWSASERFQADVDIAHHGPADFVGQDIAWELRTARGRRITSGRSEGRRLASGTVTRVGRVDFPWSLVEAPEACELEVRCGPARNTWSLWVYPDAGADGGGGDACALGKGVTVVRRYDAAAEAVLEQGGTVVFLAHGLTGRHAARTGFEGVYWSAGWWGNPFSHLGILCDPRHPALAGFPNPGHSDWCWEPLVRGATTFRFGGERPGRFRPIVQVVPDFHDPAMLAQVFECRVGPGRLLVCGYDLDSDLALRPAARQFRVSLGRYLGSKSFRPRASVSPALAREWLGDLAPRKGGG